MQSCAALTAKQIKFVAEYLVDGNGARAAVAAGYGRAGAKVTAHRLTHANRAVQAEIARRQAMDTERLGLARQDAIRGLLDAVALAREQRNPMGMIAAWKTLATMCGFMAPQRHQVEISAAADAEMGRYDRLSDAELLKLINANP